MAQEFEQIDLSKIDFAMYERRAHELRAEAMRNGFLAFKTWLRETVLHLKPHHAKTA